MSKYDIVIMHLKIKGFFLGEYIVYNDIDGFNIHKMRKLWNEHIKSAKVTYRCPVIGG